MSNIDGRKADHIKNILSDGLANNYITPDFNSALLKLQKGFKEDKFHYNAREKEEDILRTETILGGIPDARKLAEGWSRNGAEGLGGNEEAIFRVRLLSEMNLCGRKGGVILPDGSIEKDVISAVVTVVHELKPDLETALLPEGKPPVK